MNFAVVWVINTSTLVNHARARGVRRLLPQPGSCKFSRAILDFQSRARTHFASSRLRSLRTERGISSIGVLPKPRMKPWRGASRR